MSSRAGLFALEEGLRNAVVVVGEAFDQFTATQLHLVLERLGNCAALDVATLLALEGHELHGQEIHDALKCSAGTDGHGEGHDGRAQALLDRGDRSVEVCASSVHLVDEAHARHAVAIRLTPNGLGLRLHAVDAIEHDDRTIEDTQGAFDLGREVHVPGRIHQIECVAPPTRWRSQRL